MMSSIRSVLVVALLGAGGIVAPLHGQSVFATRGLGFQMEPQDARSRGFGGYVLGLPETQISWANPAATIGLEAPGLSITYQYDNFTAEGGDDDFAGESARFPMLLAAFPVGQRIALVAGFGAFLDQNWRIDRPDTLVFAGNDSVAIFDQVTSQGGVTRLRAGGAFHVVPGLGVGLAVDVYGGRIVREEARLFDPARGISDTVVGSSWSYGGVGYTAGVHWTPGAAGGVGASVSYGGTLEASPRQEGVVGGTYDLPLRVHIGGTGRLLPNTMVALAGNWTGWSSADDDLLASGGARDSWSVNGGVEWDGVTIRQQAIPLRLGGRIAALPFRWEPDGPGSGASERAISIGTGLALGNGWVRPDVALEFGNRGDGDLMDESFWRFSFSMRVLGR